MDRKQGAAQFQHGPSWKLLWCWEKSPSNGNAGPWGAASGTGDADGHCMTQLPRLESGHSVPRPCSDHGGKSNMESYT